MSKYINVDEYKRHLNMICRSGYTQQVIDIFIEWFLAIAESIATEDDVPVVHAHWNMTYDSRTACSNCKSVWDYGGYGQVFYCPYCGAKMDEKVEE